MTENKAGSMDIEQTMTGLGFTADSALVAGLQAFAADPSSGGGDMTESGPYRVLGGWSKGPVQAWLEQNTSPDNRDAGPDEVDALLTHPRVLVLTSPKGRCAVRPTEPETIADVVAALS